MKKSISIQKQEQQLQLQSQQLPPQDGQTRIPLGLNRHWLIAIACVLCVINGPVVLNWPPIRSLLVESGVYAWRCRYGDVLDSDLTCAEQRKAIALLGNLGQTFMFVGSVLAGYVADTFGPKIAGSIGAILFVLQHLCTAVSSQSFQLYIPAYILSGLGIEMSFFALITIANLYPRNQAFALSIMGTFRSISMAYALFQGAITVPGSFNIRAMSILCASIAFGTGVLTFFVLPNKPFRIIHDNKNQDDDDLEHNKPASLELADGQEASAAAAAANPASYIQSATEAGPPNDNTADEQIIIRPRSQTGLRSLGSASAGETNWDIMKRALKLAAKPVYITWLVYFALAYSRGVFYALSLQDQHPDVVDAYAILSPLSFVPCPFLGYLADKIGMLWVLTLLNTTGTVMYICLASGSSLAAQWIAVLGSCILMSFLASQNYCYITGAYSEKMQGKLAGFAMLVAGLLNFVNTPLYNWATDSDHFQSVNYIYLGVSGLLFILLGFLVLKRKTTEGYQARHPEEAATLVVATKEEGGL